MRTALTYILTLAFAVLAVPALAQNDAEDLPRVLVIGDSVYSQNVRGLGGLLEGQTRVNVVSAPNDVVLNSTTILEQLDTMLGDGDWDVIHFNVGLGDLVHRAPNMDSFRIMPIHVGGVIATSTERYEANLRLLVARLKETEAVLVWANTTPIRHSTSNVFEMGTEITYNEIAARVMDDEGVRINDMYTFARDRMDMDRPAGHGADPFHFRDIPLDQQVAYSVLTALELPADPPPAPEAETEQ